MDRSLVVPLATAMEDPALDLEAAFRRYSRYVAAVALRLLGRDDEVDDVVQEVFLAALKNARRFRGDADLGSWLTTITLNKCRGHRRGLFTRLRLVARLGASGGKQESPPADVSATDADAFERVRAGLNRLSPRWDCASNGVAAIMASV